LKDAFNIIAAGEQDCLLWKGQNIDVDDHKIKHMYPFIIVCRQKITDTNTPFDTITTMHISKFMSWIYLLDKAMENVTFALGGTRTNRENAYVHGQFKFKDISIFGNIHGYYLL
jgi:hypothetical protein